MFEPKQETFKCQHKIIFGFQITLTNSICYHLQSIESILKDFIIEELDLYGLVMKQDQNISLKSGVRDMQKESRIIAVIVFIYHLQEVTNGEIQAVQGKREFCVRLMNLFVMGIIIEEMRVITRYIQK